MAKAKFNEPSIDVNLSRLAKSRIASKKTPEQKISLGTPTFSIKADCVSVTIEDGEACLELPFDLGEVCIGVPSDIPEGTVAEACISICREFRIPCGAKVYVKVAGIQVASASYGCC